MAGYREFQTGEVLTAANVNSFLMEQATMTFADAAARDAALAEVLRAGLNVYLEDTDRLQYYDGTDWQNVPNESDVDAAGGFDSIMKITATNQSWPIPPLADPIVKMTVIGGGGGGGNSNGSNIAGTGGDTSVAGAGDTIVARGGIGGAAGQTGSSPGADAFDGLVSANAGTGASASSSVNLTGVSGAGGEIIVEYKDLTGLAVLLITIGAGGTPSDNGGDGGDGVVLIEFKAGS